MDKFPFEVIELNAESNGTLLRNFTGCRSGYAQVGPKKCVFPMRFTHMADELYNFEVRTDDVWIVTFPRSGTTWVQEMVWLMCNHLDYACARSVKLTERSPFLEFSMHLDPQTKLELIAANQGDPGRLETVANMGQQLRLLPNIKERRFIKSHLPFSLLPPQVLTSGCKVIYVARNPKDVAVSYYHHNRLLNNIGYIGDWPSYWDLFTKDLIPYTPYWAHVKEGHDQRNNPNVLFLFYEDLNRDLRSALRTLATFLDVRLTDAETNGLQTHLHIDNFRNNAAVNVSRSTVPGLCRPDAEGFVRDGRTADSAKYFVSTEIQAKYVQWMTDNHKKHQFDLTFPV